MSQELRKIPQVNKILELDEIQVYLNKFNIKEIKELVNTEIDKIRKDILSNSTTFSYDNLLKNIHNSLNNSNPYSLKRVINGTGTILHTNLGRAVLSNSAIENIVNTCSNYSNLEFDLDKGERGSRYSHLEYSLAKTLGCEASLVLNNNAAATMLAVGAFSKNKEVVVSRGELIEIGGSFRIPDIIEASGAKMVEVGTTNRTHLKDYQNATTEETSMYLKVHTSNYKVVGFTKDVVNEELVQLAKENNVMTLEDLGSGALIDFSKFNIQKESTVKESLDSGIDLVTFSGDKLLGGPQCGIIVGKKEYIDKIKKHPLTRAFRVCKLTIAALEATLRDYLDEKEALKNNPTLRMLTTQSSEVKKVAQRLKRRVTTFDVTVEKCDSTFGGGSQPTSKIESYGLLVPTNHPNKLAKYLRNNYIPIVVLLKQSGIFIDCRTLLGDDIKIISECLNTYNNKG